MAIPSSIYNPLQIQIPTSGMNMNIEEEVLPSSYAASLVNFIPSPIGSITLRNVTESIRKLENKTIVDVIPYAKKDGSESFFYVSQTYVKIEGYSALGQDDHTLVFTKNMGVDSKYLVAHNKMSIVTDKGAFDRTIINASVDPENVWHLEFDLSVDSGVIGNVTALSFYRAQLYSNQDKMLFSFIPVYKLRGFMCMNRMLFCTGADPIQLYDDQADAVSPLVQVVPLKIKVSGQYFAFDHQASYNLNPHVEVEQNGTYYTLTNITDTTFNLVDADGGKPNVNALVNFRVYPPYSAFCTVLGGRLWFLGEGGISQDFKPRDEAMKASYSYDLNRLDSFLNTRTGLISYIDLSGIVNEADSLDRIEEFFGYLAFFGKKNIYLYSGIYPDQEGAFSFSRRLSVGLYHPDLLQKVARDMIFVSQGGMKKLSTQDVLEKVSVEDINGLDFFIRDCQSVKNHQIYLRCGSVFHENTRQLLFKTGQEETIVMSVFNERYSPYLYSGDFRKCASIAQGRDCVYLCLGEDILCYQEEVENTTDAVSGFIPFVWKTPTFSFQGKTFAIQNLIFNAESDPEFSIGLKSNKSDLSIEVSGISGLTGRNMTIAKSISLESFGDFIQGFTLKRVNNYGILQSIEFVQSLRV
jgi:hypothetical protein